MPFVSDDELFGSGRPSPAPQRTSGKFVSDAELFGDNADTSGADFRNASVPTRPQLPARPTPQQLEQYSAWKDRHDDFGRPVEPLSSDWVNKPKPARREYTSTTNEGMFAEDLLANAKEVFPKAARSVVDLADWAYDSVIADPMRLAAKGVYAAKSDLMGVDHKTSMQAADKFSQDLVQHISSPLGKAIDYFFPGAEVNESYAQQAMGELSKLITKGGDKVEVLTNGKITQEDVTYLVELGMAVPSFAGAKYGQKGIDAAGKKVVDWWDNPEKPTSATDTPPESGPSGGGSRAEDPNYFADYQARKAKETDLNRSDARINAEQTAYDLMQRGASKADVERIVRRNPLVGEAMDAILSRRGMVKDSRLGEVWQVPESAIDDGPIGSSEPWNIRPDLPELPRPGTSLAAIAKPSRKPGSPRLEFDPNKLAAIGLGATGLGLALQYAETPEEQASALATLGVLYIGKNKGLTFEKLDKLPESAPLGHILNNSEYTTLTLDRLPRNKNVFSKEEVMQQVKRSDVTQPEKTLFENALSTIKKDKFSAVELMMAVKEFAEQHEFKRVETSEYSDYGLDNIDRVKNYGAEDFDAGPVAGATTTTYTNPKVNLVLGAHFRPDVIGHTRSFVENGIRHVVEVQSDFFQKAPMLEGKAFEKAQADKKRLEDAHALAKEAHRRRIIGDPEAADFFRQVAEVMPTLGDIKQLLGENSRYEYYKDLTNVYGAPSEILRSVVSVLRKGIDEVEYELSASPDNIRFKGLAKHWPKRLVREELARASEVKETPEFLKAREAAKNLMRSGKNWEEQAISYKDKGELEYSNMAKAQAASSYERAKELLSPFTSGEKPRYLPQEQSVRFATADTVAKVEGWPERDLIAGRNNLKYQLETAQRYLDDAISAKRDLEIVARDRSFANISPNSPIYDLREMPSYSDPESGAFKRILRDYDREFADAQENIAKYKKELELLDAQPRFSMASHQGLYDRHKREVDAFTKKLGGTEVTDEHGHTWIEVPLEGKFRGPPQMYGKADVRMLAELGIGAGLGYMLADSDSQYIGAVLGAAAAAAAPAIIRKLSDKSVAFKDAAANVSRGAEETVLGVDKTLGAISTRIGNISQPLLRRARAYERNVLERSHKYLSATDAFAAELRKVPDAIKAELNRAILTNDPKKIAELLDRARNPRLTQEWNRTRRMLDEIGKELMTYGRLSGMRENYFPRIVKDVEGLMNHFGRDVRGQLEERIGEAQKRLIARRGYGLTDIERSDLINSFLQGREAMGAKPGFAKERKIQEITPELEKYYATPIQSLHSYINSAVKDIEKAKFFGRNLKRITEGEGRTVDIDASVGELLNDMNKKGEISLKQMEELAEILKARFQGGEQAPLGIITDLKNVAYMGLLGNAVSAASQLGDVATSVYMHGLRPTTAAVVRRLTRKGDVDMRNYGLEDHIAEEFVNTRKTAQALNGIFKVAGFTAVDKFGKNVALEAGRLKYMDRLKTAAGKAEFRRKYGKMFEGDTDAVMADLAAGKLTDLAREVHFTELSNMQPITKLEMPQKYLENPNGRFLYMLRTFMLKQADIVRRDAYNEIKAGNTRKGVGNLLRFGVALGVGGATADMVKDWLMGREVDFDAKDVPLNVMKTFMWTQYMTDKGEKEGYLKSFVENSLMPPYKVFNTIALYLQEAKTEKEADKRMRDVIKILPLGGKLYESHFMGGAEKSAENQVKREKTAEREALKSAIKADKGAPLSDEDLQEIRRQYRLQGVGQ